MVVHSLLSLFSPKSNQKGSGYEKSYDFAKAGSVAATLNICALQKRLLLLFIPKKFVSDSKPTPKFLRKFNVTVVNYYGNDVSVYGQPDTIRFTNGVFHLKVQ